MRLPWPPSGNVAMSYRLQTRDIPSVPVARTSTAAGGQKYELTPAMLYATSTSKRDISHAHPNAHHEPCRTLVARKNAAAAGQKYGPTPMLMRVPKSNTIATIQAPHFAGPESYDSHLKSETIPMSTRIEGTSSMGRTPHPSFEIILPPSSLSWRNRTMNHNTGATASATARPASNRGRLRGRFMYWTDLLLSPEDAFP